jgi:hypothetical protein
MDSGNSKNPDTVDPDPNHCRRISLTVNCQIMNRD